MAMLATLICVIIACRIDIAFSTMSFSGDLNLYSFPRLFILPGYLIMGFVADSDDRRLFPAVFMAGVLSSVTLVAMPFYDKGYYFFLSLYYLFIGFYVFYLTYSFMALAPRTKTPELWASFGRPFSDLVSGMIIMLLLNTKLGSLPPLATSCAHFILLAAICLLMMLGRIDPALDPEKKHAPSPDKGDETGSGDEASEAKDDKAEKKHDLLVTEDRLDAFLEKYPLTPREREVAKYLIETELTMKEISTNLFISERTAYRYSSSIYGKTGAAGRKDLLRQYLEG
jgi:DNA-binding CsgD family transcriptional regulator